MRKYPPGRSLYRGPSSLNNFVTAFLSRNLENASRRLATESFFAMVINGSATRRNSFALGRVVVISSCCINDAAMLRNMAFLCELLRLNFLPLCL